MYPTLRLYLIVGEECLLKMKCEGWRRYAMEKKDVSLFQDHFSLEETLIVVGINIRQLGLTGDVMEIIIKWLLITTSRTRNRHHHRVQNQNRWYYGHGGDKNLILQSKLDTINICSMFFNNSSDFRWKVIKQIL